MNNMLQPETITTITLKPTQTLIQRFAAFCGDCNALHTDENYARTTKFRSCIAHGMLPVSYLAFLPLESNQCIRSMKINFIKPVRIGDVLQLAWHSPVEKQIHFSFKHGHTTVISGTLQLGETDLALPTTDAPAESALVLHHLTEAAYTFNEVPDAPVNIPFVLGTPQLNSFKQLLCSGFPHAHSMPLHTALAMQLMPLCLASTYTGMYRPGKFATILDITIDYDELPGTHSQANFEGAVTFRSALTHIIKSDFTINTAAGTWARGKIASEVNDKQTATPQLPVVATAIPQTNLNGRTAVVTGASRGIGAYIAKALAASGCNVVLNYHQGQAEAEAIAEEINHNGCAKAITASASVTDAVAVKQMMGDAIHNFGQIDFLINNAVSNFLEVPFLELTAAQLEQDLDVIVKGAFHTCQAAIPHMMSRQFGRIINISSATVHVPVRGHAHYITAKSGLQGLTRALAAEFGSYNITTNIITPTLIETDLTKQFNHMQLEMLKKNIPAQRLATPADVAAAVLSVCSALGNYMNGQQIVLNGGAVPFL